MDLSSLRVLHRPNRASDCAFDGAVIPSGECFALETCLRRVVVTTDRQSYGTAGFAGFPDGTSECLAGAAAYCFLLELAAGLKSALLGESEIFAQVKCAWSAAEEHQGQTIAELRPWMQAVIADAKEVREQFLRGTGGQSYGSLLRQITGDAVDGPVLLLGAGKLAASIIPYLPPGAPIMLWNRTPARSRALLESVREGARARIEMLAPDLAAELQGWGKAALVVVCVPADVTRDALRVQAVLRRAPARRPRVAHLGIREAAGLPWSALRESITLESLFALDRRQAALRTQRTLQARRWCLSRSRLRSLDRCVSVAHGWEDLAGFSLMGAA